MNIITYPLKCRFCGAQTGALNLNADSYDGMKLSDSLLGIEDSRCDACKASHGDYQEMIARAHKSNVPDADIPTLLSASGYSDQGGAFTAQLAAYVKAQAPVVPPAPAPAPAPKPQTDQPAA